MGVSHSTVVNNASSIFSQLMFQTVVSVKNDCQNNATLTQSNVINVGTPTEVITACIAGHWSPTECQKLQSTGLSVYNISSNAKVVVLTSCKLDSTLISTLQTQLTDQINQQLQKTTDGFTAAAKDFINATQNTTDATTNTTTVSNFVKNTFTLDAVNKAINTVSLTQSSILNVQNISNSTIHDVSSVAQLESTLTLFLNNSATAAAITKLDNSGSQTISTSEKGLTDIVATLGDIFKSAFAALGNWIYAVYGFCALVIIASSVCCIFALRSDSTKSLASATGSAIEKGSVTNVLKALK